MRRRVFLNRPKFHSVAAIYAAVGKGDRGEVQLKIVDCNRAVDLDFDGYDTGARENALYKIDKLVEVLTEFRDALHKKYETKG